MRAKQAVLVALFALCACGPSPRPVPPSLENAWPTALGNERRAGYENELISDSLHVVWDHNAGSGMRASILATDSAVFVGTTNRQLLAFGTRTGRRFWDQRLEGEIPGDVVRSGRTLFLITAETNGAVHAHDMARGRRLWRHVIGTSSAGPMVDGQVVYAGNDRGYVYALRTTDGSQLWRTQVGGRVSTVPIDAGAALIVVTATDTLYRIAKADGRVLARGTIASSAAAPPALAGDTLVLATYSGAVIGVSATSLTTLWTVNTGTSVTAAPIIGSDGVIHVLNRHAEIWRIEQGRGTRVAALGGAVAASFTLVRGRYIVGRLDGTLLVTDLAGRVVARFKFDDSIPTPAAVHAGGVYVPFRRGQIVKLQ
ncbi:MAG TPA: PQQ-binding-like beta-propeller repeat protein [Longimicrobiales bacterium]